MKLKQIVTKLNDTRDKALELVGKTIGLAAEAGTIIQQARTDGENVRDICEQAGITEEVGRRFEKVAAAHHKLTSGQADAGEMRQTYLRIGMLPDPITASVPADPKPFLWPVIKACQWLGNRGSKYISQDAELREQFIREAEPIVRAYNELKGAE
jgi:hypothetical protein